MDGGGGHAPLKTIEPTPPSAQKSIVDTKRWIPVGLERGKEGQGRRKGPATWTLAVEGLGSFWTPRTLHDTPGALSLTYIDYPTRFGQGRFLGVRLGGGGRSGRVNRCQTQPNGKSRTGSDPDTWTKVPSRNFLTKPAFYMLIYIYEDARTLRDTSFSHFSSARFSVSRPSGNRQPGLVS